MRRITVIAILPAALLVLAACGASDEPAGDAGPVATLTSETGGTAGSTDGSTAGTTDDSGATAEMGDEMFGTAADVGGPYGELRDGVWAVGVAGEVEFRVTGPDTLELVGVSVADGWQVRGQEAESDKIDVDFRRGPVDYQFEVEIDDGILEIEIDQDIDPAAAGTFAVGEAGTAVVTLEGGRAGLGDVALNDGWVEVAREIDDDDIELGLRREGSGFWELWELHADSDNGALDVEVDYEIEGRFAS